MKSRKLSFLGMDMIEIFQYHDFEATGLRTIGNTCLKCNCRTNLDVLYNYCLICM